MWRMSGTVLITEGELEQARQDPACRQRLAGKYLELLLGELNKLRALPADNPRQIREGIELAGQLTDLLQQLSEARSRLAGAPLFGAQISRLPQGAPPAPRL
jgi:hypothetical protein